MSESGKDPLHQIVDLFVYAPIGLGLTAREHLPELVRKGHEQVQQQVNLARVVGRLAVKKGGPRLLRLADQMRKTAASQLSGLLPSVVKRSPGPAPAARRASGRRTPAGRPATNGRIPVTRMPADGTDDPWERPDAAAGATGNGRRPATGPAPASATPTASDSPAPARSSTAQESPAAAGSAGPDASRPAASDLAIPGYDSLAASQVVQRLDGLASDELEAVRAYEAATRARRTVLSKIAQLQSG